MDKWFTNQQSNESVIISSRIRLARNLAKYPFYQTISKEESEKMIDEAVAALKSDRTPFGQLFQYIDLDGLSESEKLSMVEKHMISPAFMKSKRKKGMLLQDDETVSIMLNEEDHIRIQSIFAGDSLDTAWDIANKMDDLIEESLEYAFDQDFGYLTSCPTNVGTGLRASFMVHLPLMERSGQLQNMIPTLSKFGMTLRGIYGEGTESRGSIYQISNQLTMGKQEGEIMESLKNVTQKIIEMEQSFGLSQELEDAIYRSYGILQYAKKISVKEAMTLLSNVRLGLTTKLLKIPEPQLTIYNIMMNIQPGNLRKIVQDSSKGVSDMNIDLLRAEYIQKVLGQN